MPATSAYKLGCLHKSQMPLIFADGLGLLKLAGELSTKFPHVLTSLTRLMLVAPESPDFKNV